MDTQTLAKFFMWCTVVNGGLITLWAIFCVAAPDLVYRVQTRFFPLPRQTFDIVIYSFLGLFKIFLIVFNVAPWIAFSILAR